MTPDPERTAKVRRIFDAAQALPPEERVAFVRAEAAGDVVVEREVNELLAFAIEIPTEALRAGAEGVFDPSPPPQDQIGPYRLLNEVGRGGYGVVYRAERTDLKSHVAIKVSQRASEGVLRRFEFERSTLASMNSPYIARLFDAGQTLSGQPYFVMEFVDGVPLHRYCRERGLDLWARLELFCKVCEGVRHAHGKGIVHRDLKPANVLVSDEGGVAIPKVLDFGLAKALEGSGRRNAGDTIQGDLLGTYEYMSPEQARGHNDDISVQTDVFALGALLYEILADEPTISRAEIERIHESGGLPKLLEVLSRREPQNVSAQIRDSARSRAVRGDLDLIVRKAMANEAARRYETVAALVDDVERHMQHRPIQAAPDSTVYVLNKFVRRNRGFVMSAALLLAVALVGAAVYVAQYYETLDANRRFRLIRYLIELDEAVQEAEDMRPDPNDRKHGWQGLATQLADHVRQNQSHWDDALKDVAEFLREVLGEDPDGVSDLVGENFDLLELEQASWLRALKSRPHSGMQGPPRLPEDVASLSPGEQFEWAQRRCNHLIGADRVFGEEEAALTVLLSLSESQASSRDRRAKIGMMLTFALAWNGRLEDARKELKAALDLVEQKDTEMQRLGRCALALCNQLASGAPSRLKQVEAEMEAAVDRAEAELLAARLPDLTDPAIRSLAVSLLHLRRRIHEFRNPDGGPYSLVGRRAVWASHVGELTREERDGLPTWEDARVAILAADGVQASGSYASWPIDLIPQEGLVPLGKNPTTGLWEFYHLRSAWDPLLDPVPAGFELPEIHAETGDIRPRPETGIVFVLVPGGAYRTGRSPWPFWSSTSTDLEPFFMSRHELTQGQFVRLARRRQNPSMVNYREQYFGMNAPPTEAHPVEMVSWDMATQLLEDHGLLLPTEFQWEICARAGSATDWWTGSDVETLQGRENVLDEYGAFFLGIKGEHAQFRDGWMCHAPVGTFMCNPWGFYDVHGNVAEWCRDTFVDADEIMPRAGDGLRVIPATHAETVDNKVWRGGSFRSPISETRAGSRIASPPTTKGNGLGLRVVRKLDR